MIAESTIAAAIVGGIVVALIGLALLKLAEFHRKVRSRLRRWGRTRVVLTQAPRRSTRRRR
ncbi:hypothetical protein ACFOVU_18640 [Nocardiopsis sediminis]|uniref:Uncharacterized protein n=1 Tax=Nocardiopsis sediminis TaxID=1778267 RepID=A0ABV8FP81_9ACTN